METTLATQLFGLLAVAGSLLYAVGDVLLLAPKVGAVRPSVAPDIFAPYAGLQRRAHLFATLASMPQRRLVWGALLGVFAAPLVLAGLWVIYRGLEPAGPWLALPPVLLMAYGTAVLGPFLHGAFLFIGDGARTLSVIAETERPTLAALLARWRRIALAGFLMLFTIGLIAVGWMSAAILSGRTLFPLWMAAVNPVTLFIGWMLLRRELPPAVRGATEGAGLNIANGLYFLLATVALA